MIYYMHIFGYTMAHGSYPFVYVLHHLIIIIMQTYLKALNLWNDWQIYFVERVSKINQILSIILTQFMGLCVFNLPNSLTMIVRIHLLYLTIIIKSEVWAIYPFVMVRSWNNGIRCMSFHFLVICCIIWQNYLLQLQPNKIYSKFLMKIIF